MGAELKKLYTENYDFISKGTISNMEPIEIDKIINKVLAKIYRERTGENVIEDIFKITNTELSDAIDLGTESLKDGIKNIALSNNLKASALVFSTFKSHHQANALVALLTDGNGKIVTFTEFKKEALKITGAYNVNWLRSEYETALRRAVTASNFQKYRETANVYPNLRWTPSRASEPDAEHEKLYGLVLPIDDPFWVDNFPGNRWGCKCGLERTKTLAGKAPLIKVKPPKGLDGNPAFTNDIISKSHPYYKGFDKVELRRIKIDYENFLFNTPYKSKPDYSADNGEIFIHTFADKNDLEENFEAAKKLLEELELQIKIRPHVQLIETGIGKNNRSNPEFEINGKLADLKKIEGKNVSSGFKSAKNQGNQIVVFQIESDLTIERVIEKIDGEINSRPNGNPFEDIYVIKGGEVIKY